MEKPNLLVRVLHPLASLKLTVVLLCFAGLLVFMGTLAQSRMNVEQAKERYFRTFLAHIEPADLLPPALMQESGYPKVSKDLENWQDKYEQDKIAEYKNTIKDPEQLQETLADKWNTRYWIPFPGGFTIGFLLVANLLAAHGLKFKVQTRDPRKITTGLALVGLGAVLCLLVIVSEQNARESATSNSSPYSALWIGIELALAALWTISTYGVMNIGKERKIERIGLGLVGAISFALFAYLIYAVWGTDANPLSDNSSRILWQLIKGGLAATVLLTGCYFLFNKRAGVVLLHAGVLLIMSNELVVFLLHTEWRMDIPEKEMNWVGMNLEKVELAMTSLPDGTRPTSFEVVSLPVEKLEKSLNSNEPIRDRNLPCDVLVTRYFENSRSIPAVNAAPEDTFKSLTPRAGLQSMTVKRLPRISGASGNTNTPSVWVTLYKKGTQETLGKYLLFAGQGNGLLETYERKMLVNPANDPTPVCEIDGRHYELSLRFKREYKPYTIYVKDTRGDNYLGSLTPRNYSSDITMYDNDGKKIREKNIRMNDPLRQGNETIYQSQYSKDQLTGDETTGFQIVANQGWMIPYLGCMIVMIGMMYHFTNALVRFLGKKMREQSMSAVPVASAAGFPWPYVTAMVTVLAFSALMIYGMRPRHAVEGETDLLEMGKMGVIFKGRFKPLDTVARNSLNAISRYESVIDPDDKDEKKRLPAIRWLMDVYMKPERAANYKIFYIENYELVEQLGLEWRKSHLYSLNELDGPDKKPEQRFNHVLRTVFKDIIAEREARKKNPQAEKPAHENPLTPLQRKVQELRVRLNIYESLEKSAIPSRTRTDKILESDDIDPTQLPEAILLDFTEMLELSIESPQMVPYSIPKVFGPKHTELLRRVLKQAAIGMLEKDPFSEIVPPDGLFDQQMLPFPVALNLEKIRRHKLFRDKEFELHEGVGIYQNILIDYANDKSERFNESVHAYQEYLQNYSFGEPYHYDQSKMNLEHWFNNWSPFHWLMPFYIIGMIAGLISLFCLNTRFEATLQKTTFWFVIGVLCFHTIAIVLRIIISDRPPVTNLYSSAIFIGWGIVVLSLVIEKMTRSNIGSIAAGLAGFSTILVSNGIYGDLKTWAETGGDTMGVMRAVLDTQFWLSTHVVCVSLGYAMTFLAGGLGLLYLVLGLVTRGLEKSGVEWLDSTFAKTLSQKIYATLCFAIFFSFVGTVLGGLWADDSWGRFWGWDPKENGALLIVIWNAVVLHARWDALVKDRGLAALTLFGSVVTAWSWFGVNELDIGLHTYGQTEGTLRLLFWFATGHIVFMIVTMLLPKGFFWTKRVNKPRSAAPPLTSATGFDYR